MDFDPLLFFEPNSNQHLQKYQEKSLGSVFPVSNDNSRQPNETLEDISKTDKLETDNFVPLQVLDLPTITPLLPYPILSTILKLFQPDQVKNFGNQKSSIPSLFNNDELVIYLNQKNINMAELSALSAYLGHSIPSILTLTQLPTMNSSGTTSYLTKIISYPFTQYTEEQTEEIYGLASYVMTASFAPASKGDATRLIEIDGLEREILLYEPALTEDKVGNITWGASLELAKQIVNGNTKSWLKNSKQPILELGAGTGLVTIVLGILDYKVMSTDLPEIIDNLEKNIKLNKLGCIKSNTNEIIVQSTQIQLTSLDWRSPNEFLSRVSMSDGYQTIILSDPVYSPQHPYWVQNTVSATLSKNKNAKVVFMVGRRDRFQDVRDNMWSLMVDLGLKEIESQVINGFDDYGVLQYDYKVFGWS
jgi:predicted nicotinamide N-methyase